MVTYTAVTCCYTLLYGFKVSNLWHFFSCLLEIRPTDLEFAQSSIRIEIRAAV